MGHCTFCSGWNRYRHSLQLGTLANRFGNRSGQLVGEQFPTNGEAESVRRREASPTGTHKDARLVSRPIVSGIDPVNRLLDKSLGKGKRRSQREYSECITHGYGQGHKVGQKTNLLRNGTCPLSFTQHPVSEKMSFMHSLRT